MLKNVQRILPPHNHHLMEKGSIATPDPLEKIIFIRTFWRKKNLGDHSNKPFIFFIKLVKTLYIFIILREPLMHSSVRM